MAEKPQITGSFWNGLVTVATIAGSTFFIINYIGGRIDDAVKPLVNRIDKLETSYLSHETKLNQLIYYNQVQDRAARPFYEFINKKFNRDFVKPEDLEFKEERQ